MPSRRQKRPRDQKKQRTCIVIGAGLAGLSAARTLVDLGWEVTVLESQDRTGGRVYSHHFDEAPKLNCELGGEWIGKDHKRMRSLCKVFHLRLQNHVYAYSFWNGASRTKTYGPTGSCFRPKTEAKFRKFCKGFRKFGDEQLRALDRMDWWTRLKMAGFSTEELLYRDLADSTDFGESIRLVSAYVAAAEYANSNDSDETDSKVVGGNTLLIDKLVDHIEKKGSRVRKNATVRRVHHVPNGVEVFIQRRSKPLRADYCICGTPAHALTKIKWDSDFPDDKRNAALQLQYSRIMKTAILYERRFWKPGKKSGFSIFTNRVSDFCFDSTFRQRGDLGILTSYAIGDKADDLAGEANRNNVMKWITEDVASAVQPPIDTIIAPIAIKTQPWQSQEWVGGAYAFYRPGQWFTVRPALLQPFKRVFFAGEHLSERWQGFMEGAVETGEAAAKSVVEATL
jgi:monoamine oxidase